MSFVAFNVLIKISRSYQALDHNINYRNIKAPRANKGRTITVQIDKIQAANFVSNTNTKLLIILKYLIENFHTTKSKRYKPKFFIINRVL